MNLVDVFSPASYLKPQPPVQSEPTNRPDNPESTKAQINSSLNPETRSDHTKIQKVIEDINQKLQHENQLVVFDYDAKAHRVWLNVIDKQTGKVLDELPPKVIRQLIDSLGDIKGLVIDKRS